MIALIVLFTIVAAIVWLNVWHWRRRRKMTPQERAAEDEEIRAYLQEW